MRRLVLAAVTACLAAAPAVAQAPLKAGRAAPAFTTADLSGRPLSLAAYRGKVVLLDFWATWCVPCREEIPHFVALQKKYGDRGFAVIGISMDDAPAPVVRFSRELAVNYPIAVGDAKLAERYGGILGLPVAFLIDREGRIRQRHDGQTDPAVFEREIVELLGKPTLPAGKK